MLEVPADYDAFASAMERQASSAPPDPSSQHRQDQAKVRVYGGRAAATFEATRLKDGTATLNIDIAPKTQAQVLWDQKIVFQLNTGELAMVCAVLLGHRSQYEWKRPDKGCRLERQQGHLFLSASSSGKRYALPVKPEDAFNIAGLALHQCQQASPHQDSALMLAAVAGCAGLHESEATT